MLISKKYMLLGCVILVIGFLSPAYSQINTFCGVAPQSQNREAESAVIFPLSTNHLQNDVVYIQTVVHVLYSTPEQNIPDSVIVELIEDLNKIYRKEVDTTMINPALRSIAVDSRIQFCLAAIAPDGGPTNGINHVATNVASFEVSSQVPESVKMEELGGADPWDTDQYLNIWIAENGTTDEHFNYAISQPTYLPLGPLVSDDMIPGVVYDRSTIFGNSPNSPIGVLAHECGHALGLMHTTGDPPSPETGCDYDDGISDTPLCGFLLFPCGTPDINSCIEPGDDKMDNLSNIMFYTCAIMITHEQAQRMYQNLTLMGPSGLWTYDEACTGTSTSIEEIINLESSLRVIPNPSNGQFDLVFQNSYPKEVIFSLIDMHGHIIKTAFAKANTRYNENWNLLWLPPGMYFLRVRTHNKIYTRKVVIN